MAFTKEDLLAKIEDLKRERDELNLKLHLAKGEVRLEWQKLEHKWEAMQGKMKRAGHEAERTTEAVGTAIELAMDEIRKGYERIRRTL